MKTFDQVENVVVANYVNTLNAGTSEDQSALNAVRAGLFRAFIYEKDSISYHDGNTTVLIDSAGQVYLNQVQLSASNLADIRVAVVDAQKQVEQQEMAASLRNYLSAMRHVSHSGAYSQIGLGPSSRHVPLDIQVLKADGHTVAAEGTITELISNLDPEAARHSLVLAGQAGAGKSSTMRYLCEVVAAASEEISMPLIPMYIRLPELAIASGAAIEDRLWNALSASPTIAMTGKRPPSGYLESWQTMLGARWLLLLDGFDEVPTYQRPELTAWLNLLRQKLPCWIVIGIRWNTDDAGLKCDSRWAVKALSDRLLHQLMAEYAADASDNFAERFHGSTAIDYAELPLGVVLAAAAFRRDGVIPETLPKLLWSYVSAVLTEGRVRHPGLPRSDLLLKAAEVVAIEESRQRLESRPFGRDAATRALQRGLAPELSDGAAFGANELIAALDQLGLVTLTAATATWTHESVRSFLAARFVANQFDGRDLRESILFKNARNQFADAFVMCLCIKSDPNAFALDKHVEFDAGPLLFEFLTDKAPSTATTLRSILGMKDDAAIVRGTDAVSVVDAWRGGAAISRKWKAGSQQHFMI